MPIVSNGLVTVLDDRHIGIILEDNDPYGMPWIFQILSPNIPRMVLRDVFVRYPSMTPNATLELIVKGQIGRAVWSQPVTTSSPGFAPDVLLSWFTWPETVYELSSVGGVRPELVFLVIEFG